MGLAEPLLELLVILRRAYPRGVPPEDYDALLLVLQGDMSAENLAAVVAELVDGDPVVVENDAAAAASVRRPSSEEVWRVQAHLTAHGWKPEIAPDD